jgi:hypothetical protein
MTGPAHTIGPLLVAAAALGERVSDHCERHNALYTGVGVGTAVSFAASLTTTIQLIGLGISLGTAIINAITQIRRERSAKPKPKTRKNAH